MSSNQTLRDERLNSSNRVAAFFRNKDDAYRAISQLQAQKFTSNEIGVIEGRNDNTATKSKSGHNDPGRDNESMWQKITDFFTGESNDDSQYDYDQSVSGMDWDKDRANYYYQGISAGGALVSVSGTRADEARRILQNAGGDLRDSGFEDLSSARARTSADSTTPATGSTTNERRIQLRGEVLRTYKQRVQRGQVSLRKEVVTENQTVQVPVTTEELVIERVPGSGQAQASEIGNDEEVRIPLSEERVHVDKRPVVTEEVRVGKRAVQNTEQVSDNIRHEELRVEKKGEVKVDPDLTKAGKNKKPAA